MEERLLEATYIISDVSRLIDVEPHVLRYWEEELSLNITRNQLGHRYYKESDIEMLKRIKELKEQGLQLRAIKVVLSNFKMDELNGSMMKTPANVSVQDNTAVVNNGNNKMRQFQEFMKEVIQSTLKENNAILKEELTTEVSTHMKAMLLKQEEIEEKRYRKLDETIREIQRVRQEVAATQPKSGFFKKKR